MNFCDFYLCVISLVVRFWEMIVYFVNCLDFICRVRYVFWYYNVRGGLRNGLYVEVMDFNGEIILYCDG